MLAALAAGALIGLVLGLVGGGGSILAVPLLVYGVGVASPHGAIGTAAIAVALNAAASLAGHARPAPSNGPARSSSPAPAWSARCSAPKPARRWTAAGC